MRKEIADLVFPVFRKAIEIKEGLRANEKAFNFVDSQKRLLALLQAPVPDHLRSDILGDQRAIDASVLSTSNRLGYLGIRYALACWLDDIFILDSAWRVEWNNSKVETTLYGINERGHEFWDQAKRASTRPTRDALEVYYLCVMLGFRGDKAEQPVELNAWRESVEPQITQGSERQYTAPPGLTIPPDVKALSGARVMQRWFMIAIIIGLLFIPLIIILVGRS